MTEDDIAAARRWFAEELRHVARVRSPAVVRAFATVPREHFAGPGPWRLLSPWYLRDYWTTEDADPRHLYHDVLVAIDEARRLNNGQPSLWAFLYDQLDLAAGEHVVHVGIGTGYYSAILADIVGRDGAVTAVEIDAALAARARTNLASLAAGQCRRSGRLRVPAGAAGRCHHRQCRRDASVGRVAGRAGRAQRPAAGAVDRCGPGRRVSADHAPARTRASLRRAQCLPRRHHRLHRRSRSRKLRKIGRGTAKVGFEPSGASLRRPPDEPDETCWLAGDGWWLSTAPPDV